MAGERVLEYFLKYLYADASVAAEVEQKIAAAVAAAVASAVSAAAVKMPLATAFIIATAITNDTSKKRGSSTS